MHHSQNMIITLSCSSHIKITIQKMNYKNKCVGFFLKRKMFMYIYTIYPQVGNILTLDIDRPESYNVLGISLRFTRNNKIAASICERINTCSFYFSNKTMKSFVCINHDKTAYHN